jgi:uncharacterized protein YndB with AHSA1/START domain
VTVAPVLRATHVRRPAEQAFALFTDRIGAWWPLPTHGLFGDRSAEVGFEDGRLVERSVDGETTVWGEVLVWDPPKRLRLAWHPGGSGDGPASTVEVTFIPDDEGTRVELVHDGWQAFGEQASARRRSYAGPSAWGYVLDHLTDLVEVSTPDEPLADDPDGAAAAALHAAREAYRTFFTEAEAGGFGPAPEGEWGAERVVAHLAVNDGLMAAACRSLIHRQPPRLENGVSNDVAVLDRLVDACAGDLGRLVTVGRQRAEQLALLLARLDGEQRETPVPTRLVDHGTVVVDEPRPWWSLAVGVSTRYHLPAHTEQLRALRRG